MRERLIESERVTDQQPLARMHARTHTPHERETERQRDRETESKRFNKI